MLEALIMLMAKLISDVVLDAAYDWLCRRRRDYPDHADVWDFRHHWPAGKARLQADLSAGDFRFGLLDRITKADGGDIDLWSARDALVLKALALVLGEHLPISPRCTHVRGHGGAKAAVRQVWAGLAGSRFVLRTDVKSYYAPTAARTPASQVGIGRSGSKPSPMEKPCSRRSACRHCSVAQSPTTSGATRLQFANRNVGQFVLITANADPCNYFLP